MAKLCTLASGSTGNSTYISTPDGDILIDAGISCKALLAAINDVGCNIANLRAVAVTHSHTDHIKGLKSFLANTKIPVVASSETLEYLTSRNMLPADARVLCIESGGIEFGNIALDFFSTSHDSAGSGGYVVTLPDSRRAAVCTDLGIVTDEVRKKLYGCETVLIEANHDIEMLKHGPYPAQLKLRILSDIGHLSNNACAAELPALVKGGTTRIILGHLSRENNTPALACASARATLAEAGAVCDNDYILKVAKPKTAEVTVF